MAKSKKKPAAKPAKKTAKKAKSAAKAKKATPAKAKKPVSKKPATKKIAAKKKVVAKKKAAAKKAAPKAAAAKKIKAPAKVIASKAIAKKEKPAPVAKKKAAEAAPKKVEQKPVVVVPKKAVPQLTNFPIVNQRPIAHKPKQAPIPSDKTRYNDDELKEFETLILGKLGKAREEFRILKETLNRNNDAGTDATSGGNTKVLEDGAETAEKENLSQLAARQLKYMTNLEHALVRIKNHTYGICSVTGKLIPKERLIAVPHTTQSIEAKMMKKD